MKNFWRGLTRGQRIEAVALGFALVLVIGIIALFAVNQTPITCPEQYQAADNWILPIPGYER